MNRLIYAASEQCADLWYESGFSAPDSFLWFEIDGKRHVVVSPLEVGRAQKQVNEGVEVISFADAKTRWNLGKDSKMDVAEVIGAMSASNDVTVWEVPDGFPFGLAEKLRKHGLELTAKADFSPTRAVKTPQEVEKIRTAIRMTEDGLKRAFEILKDATVASDGVLKWNGEVLTAELLGAEINIAIARMGGEAKGTITAPGRQGADPHCVGFGPIHADEPIVMDVFPRDGRTGYFGDLTRTVVKGTAPEIVRKTFETVKKAQELAIGMIKPGVIGKEPHCAVAEFFAKCGYKTDLDSTPAIGFFHGLGHGIGLEIHEEPRLSLRIEKALVAGNVVTVEPGLYYPEWGGIRIEDDVLVTEDGCEKLSSLPVFLEV